MTTRSGQKRQGENYLGIKYARATEDGPEDVTTMEEVSIRDLFGKSISWHFNLLIEICELFGLLFHFTIRLQ